MESHHKFAIYTALAYAAFIIVANILMSRRAEGSTEESFLDYFSVSKNTGKLFSETNDPLAKKMSFFHGIRFYYQLVAISAHICDIQPFMSAIYREWLFFYCGSKKK